ncbi:MAG: hypothetical protein QOE53_214 [Pseudonocardiales bacterium]|jgi:hypothetical protein|nr:hypothetical protein [Pseudonocardiales bacterium]
MTAPHGHKFADDKLFVKSVNDLDQQTRLNADSYDLLSVPPLLRRLLTDGTPLMDVVNRQRRFPIRFQVYPYRLVVPIGNNSGWLTREYLDPEAGLAEYMTQMPGDRTAHHHVARFSKHLRRDAFLKFPVVISADEKASVLDMINHYSYTTGALHGDNPDPKSLISQLPTYNQKADERLDPVEQTIVGIGRVVVRALRPLVLAIEGNYHQRMKGDTWLEVDEETARTLLTSG